MVVLFFSPGEGGGSRPIFFLFILSLCEFN